MKKFIVVFMVLITIFSASVTSYAASYVDWDVVDYFTNISYANYNCSLVFKNTAKPVPNMSNLSGVIGTQKTSYNVLYDLYETVTLKGASFQANAALGGVFHWYKYGDYCWIKYDLDNSPNTMWVGNYQGKILYCDAPAEEITYTISAIAGAPTYFLTDRPINTITSGYLGDLKVSYANWSNILSTLNNLSGSTSYYAYVGSVNGEYRYYILTLIGGNKFLVCNSAGQLFYSIKDEVPDDDDTGGGSTFDPTEVITAINSVYSAINDVGSNISTRLSNLRSSVENIGGQFDLHMNNTVSGFESIGNQLSTLNSYFTDLSGLFPVQETITLLGSDTRVAWDSADRITNVTTAGFNGDLIVKERAGDLVDESGYERVTINETEYSLYNDNNGYRRIKAANEYPDTGPAIPENSLFYFPFDGTLSSVVGDATLAYNGSDSFADGVDGSAFVFSANQNLISRETFDFITSDNGAFSFAFWFYSPSNTNSNTIYSFDCNTLINYIHVGIAENGYLRYSFSSSAGEFFSANGSDFPIRQWNHIAFCFDGAKAYCFLNGNLDYSGVAPQNFGIRGKLSLGGAPAAGAMIDDCIFVDGTALWTTDFNPYEDAIFSEIAKDYFLACSDQEITLNFHDTTVEQVTEHRWNQYTVNTSRLPNGYTELDYIRSTGTQYINSNFYPTNNTVIEAKVGSSNGHFFSATQSGVPRFGFYLLQSGQVDYAIGSSGYKGAILTGVTSPAEIVFRNGSFTGNGTVGTFTSQSAFTCTSPLSIFAEGTSVSSGEVYYYKIYNNGTLVRDFVPCKNPSNAVGLYDLVNDQFYGNSGTGSFTAGNEVSNGSGIGQLVGVVSSTNRNAYPDDGEQNGFYYEYIGAYTEYPSFSQTLSPTDVNGNAITMGRLEDDFSEIYMDISTMMWYCHDPQTQTEILLSSANQQIMNDTIYVRQNYTMLPADQITADALQNLLPVDSPVYLDMPEGAKLTITYDHYTGWFRMMYILMDKQTKLLSDLDIVSETIINVENTVIDITNNNPAYNVFYITKTDGTTESVGDAAKDAAVFVGDILSMFYRLVFDDALDNVGILKDFEGAYSNTEVSVW